MTSVKSLLTAAAASLIATAAQAQMPYVELEIAATATNRSGDALASSGITFEDGSTTAGSISGLAAFPLQNGIAFQVEGHFEHNSYQNPVQIFGPFFGEATDNYEASRQIAVQVSYAPGPQLNYAAFVGHGRMRASDSDREQDTNYTFGGVGFDYAMGPWDLGLDLGLVDSSAVDPEALDNGRFARVTGRYAFNDDRTALSLSVFRVSGEQDTDSGSGPDPLRITGASVEVEHALNLQLGNASSALFARAELLDIRESGSCCVERVRDKNLILGVRIRFGGAKPDQGVRGRQMNWVRIMGSVLAVD